MTDAVPVMKAISDERLAKLIEGVENAKDLSAGYLAVDPGHRQTIKAIKFHDDELLALRELQQLRKARRSRAE